VSLDTEKLHKLRGKKFDDLYRKHQSHWDEMVENATTFARSYANKNKEPVHPGDVSKILRNSISVDPFFEKHLETKGLQQKYWVEYFCDYIVEQKYKIPTI
jgi:hypothetical protein